MGQVSRSHKIMAEKGRHVLLVQIIEHSGWGYIGQVTWTYKIWGSFTSKFECKKHRKHKFTNSNKTTNEI